MGKPFMGECRGRDDGLDFNAQIKRPLERGTPCLVSRDASLGASSGSSERSDTEFSENKLKSPRRHARRRPPEFNYSCGAIRPNERHLCPMALRVMSHPIFIHSIRFPPLSPVPSLVLFRRLPVAHAAPYIYAATAKFLPLDR